jgi:hypothetical protein
VGTRWWCSRGILWPLKLPLIEIPDQYPSSICEIPQHKKIKNTYNIYVYIEKETGLGGTERKGQKVEASIKVARKGNVCIRDNVYQRERGGETIGLAFPWEMKNVIGLSPSNFFSFSFLFSS